MLGGGPVTLRRSQRALFTRVKGSTKQDDHNDETRVQREIIDYNEQLQDFQTDIGQLPDLCPTVSETRKRAINVARIIADNHHLRTFFLKTKTLPIHELSKQSSACQEVIHKYPQYITAITLLFIKDYQHIMDCLQLDI